MSIKLFDIIPAPWNPREDITPDSVAELAADIEANGLINPITIWNRESDGAWLCIAGLTDAEKKELLAARED